LNLRTLGSALALVMPMSVAAEIEDFETVLDATGCEIVLNQTTNSCRTILHAVCSDRKTAAIYFDAEGKREFSRVMVEGVNQTTFQSSADGLVFVRDSMNDDRVDFSLVQRGETDTFHFTSRSTAGRDVVITMAGTVRRLPDINVISDQEISYLYWDWTYTVETPNGSYASEIETKSEFHDALGLWLGNYVQIRDTAGSVNIINDFSKKLLRPGHNNFEEIVTQCPGIETSATGSFLKSRSVG